jgi:subtilisin family serine protease
MTVERATLINFRQRLHQTSPSLREALAKTRNAQNAGAVGVIIYNNVVDDLDQDGGTLGAPGNWIPAVSISKADGKTLQALGTPLVTLVNRPAPDPLAYGVKSGTSMAAPFVTGIAGLILSKNPTLDYAGIKSALLSTVDKIPAVAAKIASGGRVNALAALCSTLSLAGDLSFDNKVGLDDAIIALQIASSTGSNVPICPVSLAPAMDIDGDGTIGLQEAIYVLRKVAGLSN